MNEDKDKLKEQVALFRHRLIARLVAAHLTPQQRQHEIAHLVAQAHEIPGTTRTRVAETTLRDWLRAYGEGGFEALIPKKRIDAGHLGCHQPPSAPFSPKAVKLSANMR